MVEIAQQSWQLVRNFAVKHMRLVHQIKRMGLAQELDQSAMDDMLDAVANGGEVPVAVPQIPAVRHVAAATGAPGQQSMDADTPPASQATSSVRAVTEAEPTLASVIFFRTR